MVSNPQPVSLWLLPAQQTFSMAPPGLLLREVVYIICEGFRLRGKSRYFIICKPTITEWDRRQSKLRGLQVMLPKDLEI